MDVGSEFFEFVGIGVDVGVEVGGFGFYDVEVEGVDDDW